MIFPVPWHLFRENADESAGKIPESAIDTTTYPPYRLVWCLEGLDRQTGLIVGEVMLEKFDSGAFRKILRRPPSDPMVGGEWAITPRNRDKVERLIGKRLHLSRYSYFIGARALNFSEVKEAVANG